MLADQYRLDGVVTLVDAVNGSNQLDQQPEAVKQAAIADRLLITKTDLVERAQVQALQARLRALNPHAPLSEIVMGNIDPVALTNIGLSHTRADSAGMERWLGKASLASKDSANEGYLGHRLQRHDRAIDSFTLWFDEPFTWALFTAAMELLTRLRGPDLLRVKGFVNVHGERGPVVVQGVQHIFHPPLTLDAVAKRGSPLAAGVHYPQRLA